MKHLYQEATALAAEGAADALAQEQEVPRTLFCISKSWFRDVADPVLLHRHRPTQARLKVEPL